MKHTYSSGGAWEAGCISVSCSAVPSGCTVLFGSALAAESALAAGCVSATGKHAGRDQARSRKHTCSSGGAWDAGCISVSCSAVPLGCTVPLGSALAAGSAIAADCTLAASKHVGRASREYEAHLQL